MVERRTGRLSHRFDSPEWREIFLPESTFSADSLRCVCTPLCAISGTGICAHFKEPVVHISVRWIMETLKHPVCTVSWVVRPCCRWLSLGEQPESTMGEIPKGQYSRKKLKICSVTPEVEQNILDQNKSRNSAFRIPVFPVLSTSFSQFSSHIK